jgi:hypothetical protein
VGRRAPGTGDLEGISVLDEMGKEDFGPQDPISSSLLPCWCFSIALLSAVEGKIDTSHYDHRYRHDHRCFVPNSESAQDAHSLEHRYCF